MGTHLRFFVKDRIFSKKKIRFLVLGLLKVPNSKQNSRMEHSRRAGVKNVKGILKEAKRLLPYD